jgi:NADH-quinone oxidoreductase subunit H
MLLNYMLWHSVHILLSIIVIHILILIAVAYFTLIERKTLAVSQRRQGPNAIGFLGLLQPLADGLKFFIKERVSPGTSNKVLFIFAPILTFVISMFGWSLVPFSAHGTLAEVDLGALYLLGIASLGVYGILVAGWSSNSKYAYLGALRSAAQVISYELVLGFTICAIAGIGGSFSLADIVESQRNVFFGFAFFPLFFIFFVAGLAETNRHPFDLPEAESELVSGYNVEYASMLFAMFSLSEYSCMLLMSALHTILFFGGWLPIIECRALSELPGSFWFALKMSAFVEMYVWARAGLPRYRYDQLMGIGWRDCLPLLLGYTVFIYVGLYLFDALPY